MTMATTLANIWRYRFHNLNESDHNNITDGNEFFVQYIGCTAITSEDDEMVSDIQIDDFFNYVVSNYKESPDRLVFKLLVNRNGATICDREDNIQHNFEAHNISYVTTSSNWRYSKYLIIVARTGQQQSLKGHVLFCKNKSKAKRICHTFAEMFKMAAPVTLEKDCTKGEVERRNQDDDVFETGSGRDLNGNTVCRVTIPSPLNNYQAECEDLLDGFTELAKSRISSGTPHSAFEYY
jgi:hypothetical protein